ncbi:hypothetical protein [Kurthia senegalensis]|uniref:hypothetical protein n=1 Tax=Kurthia senegalensis TaxID=1033740 RepID=UPI0028FCAC09|nr:hypothetical protein [Kurthia senegalensis]
MTVEQRTATYIQKEIPGDLVTPISLYHSLYGKKKYCSNQVISTKKAVAIHLLQQIQ